MRPINWIFTALFIIFLTGSSWGSVTTVGTLEASWSVTGADFSALTENHASFYPGYQSRLEVYYHDAADIGYSVPDNYTGDLDISSLYGSSPTPANVNYSHSYASSAGSNVIQMNSGGGSAPTSASAVITSTAFAEKSPTFKNEALFGTAGLSGLDMWFPDARTGDDWVLNLEVTCSTSISQSGSLPWSAYAQFYARGSVLWSNAIGASGPAGHSVFFDIVPGIAYTETGTEVFPFTLRLNPYDEEGDFYGYEFPEGFIPTYGRVQLNFWIDTMAYESVPEPATLLLLGLGGLMLRKRRRA